MSGQPLKDGTDDAFLFEIFWNCQYVSGDESHRQQFHSMYFTPPRISFSVGFGHVSKRVEKITAADARLWVYCRLSFPGPLWRIGEWLMTIANTRTQINTWIIPIHTACAHVSAKMC